jgi:Cu/Ag efflux protein CusF
MRKTLVVAASLASFMGATAAFAGTDVTGAIKSIDTKAKTITLADGTIYMLPKKFDASTLKVGEKVAVVYDKKNGKMMASSVKPAT